MASAQWLCAVKAALVNSGVRYLNLHGGHASDNSTEADVAAPLSAAGQLLGLVVKLSGAPGTGASYQVQVSINGTPSATLSVTISGNVATTASVAGSVALSFGDLVTLAVTPSGTPAAVALEAWVEFFPTSTDHFVYPGGFGSNSISNSLPPLRSGLLHGCMTPQSSDSHVNRSLAPFAGQITDFAVSVNTAPGGATAWNFVIERNGSEEASSAVSITGSNKTASVTGLTIAVAAGDYLVFKLKSVTGLPVSTTGMNFGATFVPTSAGYFALCGSTNAGSSQVATRFGGPTGAASAGSSVTGWNATESAVSRTAPSDLTAVGMAVRMAASPAGSDGWSYKSRNNVADGNLAIAFTGSTVTGTDTSHTDAIVSGNTFAIKVAPTGVPNGMSDNCWAMGFTGPAVAIAAAASFSASAALAANALLTLEAAAALAASGTMSGDTITTHHGETALSASAALSATATATRKASASLAGTAAIAGTASNSPFGNAALAAVTSLAAEATQTLAVAAAFAAPTALSATARVTATRRTPSEPAQARVLSLEQATVSIHYGHWPRHRLAILPTAHAKDRSLVGMDSLQTGRQAGEAHIRISLNDPAIGTDAIEEGNILVIEQPNLPTWAGPIQIIEQDSDTYELEISAQSIEAQVDGRDAPQSFEVKKSFGSNGLLRSVLDQANARNHTGILPALHSELAPPVEQIQVGGQSVMQSDNEVVARTGYEWWVEVDASPQRLNFTWHMGYRQGLDASGGLHVFKGIHCTDMYKRDQSQVKAQSTAIDGFGQKLSERNSVARVMNSVPGVAFGVAAVDQSSQAAKRRFGDVPNGLRNESIRYEVVTDNTGELARFAQRAQEKPLAGAEMFQITFNRLADWSQLGIGNLFTFHGEYKREPIVRVARIIGLQPNEEQGQLVAVCEVPF